MKFLALGVMKHRKVDESLRRSLTDNGKALLMKIHSEA
jgi:hypothetical protein